MGRFRRIVVFGAPGSGKTTLARELATTSRRALVERDALGRLGSAGYRRAALGAVRGRRWVFDGAPYHVEKKVYRRADAVVVLDYARRVVMWRILKRSLALLVGHRCVGAHQPEDLRVWPRAEHPVRYAWRIHATRHRDAALLHCRPELRATPVLTFRSPAELRGWLDGRSRAPSQPTRRARRLPTASRGR